jgi:hypothetical protein
VCVAAHNKSLLNHVKTKAKRYTLVKRVIGLKWRAKLLVYGNFDLVGREQKMDLLAESVRFKK